MGASGVRGMRGAGDELMAAVRWSLDAVDLVVCADDQRFAKSYVVWVDAGKPSSEVISHRARHEARRGPVSEGGRHGHRRRLLVLMDGMSHTAAVQVLQRLRDQRRWSPIAWRVPGWNGQLPIPPVFAAAPTLTEVSRSAALFAGVAIRDSGDQAPIATTRAGLRTHTFANWWGQPFEDVLPPRHPRRA